MVNYNNGKIYKIECLTGDIDDIYIGSTTKNYLSKRMVQHRSDYKRWKESDVKGITSSFKIFDKYGVDNCIITLLENVNAKSKEELLARESYYIRTSYCVNKNIMGRTRKEWEVEYYEQNKERIKEYQMKPEIKEQRKIKRSIKVKCEICNLELQKYSLKNHKTNKH
jgi:hypothetical protein